MDDVTIEDEFEPNEEISSRIEAKTSSLQWSYIFQILSQQWTILFLLIIGVATYLYINRNRRRNTNCDNVQVSHDPMDRYNHMELIRQRQQKAYEEQALRHAEQKKARMEALKASQDEKPSPTKYRVNDHNPLTGQSTRGSGDSCSWRPSSRRKPAGG